MRWIILHGIESWIHIVKNVYRYHRWLYSYIIIIALQAKFEQILEMKRIYCCY